MRGRPGARRALVASGLAAALALPAPAVWGQGREPTLGDMALHWAQGDFRAPLICEIEGVPRRALRSVAVEPVRRTHRPTNRVVFHDLEAPPETRCHDEQGADEPNVVGSVTLVHESRRDRPDLAQHDFGEALRREGGFSYRVASGRLQVGAPGEPVSSYRTVSFDGGKAELRTVERGTDAFRRLADFGPARKLQLVLEAPDGTRLGFDLVELPVP